MGWGERVAAGALIVLSLFSGPGALAAEVARREAASAEDRDLHSEAYASLALDLIGRVPLRGTGVVDVTTSVLLPGSADLCPRDRAWREGAKLLEVIEVRGGTARAEARMRAECGARVFADLRAAAPHFLVVLNGPNNRSGELTSTFSRPDGRQISVVSVRRLSKSAFDRRAKALATTILNADQ